MILSNTSPSSINKEELIQNGYAHLKYSPLNSIEQTIASFGKTIFKTEIRENTSSTRLLASNKPMNFHSDHYNARFIAWFCNSQSIAGGESLLIDAYQLINSFSESSKILLTEITIKSHNVFYGDKLSYPLLNLNEGKIESVYYAPWMVNTPGCIKHKKALEKFENLIMAIDPVKILLSEGDLLIIDNHRMLHGREGFPSASNRWLTRYWLSDNTNQKPNK
jgi:hypothetical protein